MANQMTSSARIAAPDPEQRYYRRGLGLKKEVKPVLASEYGSALMSMVRDSGNELTAGRVRIRMAKSMGFCYGVERAVEYAYEARQKFPRHRIFLVGEIIHNPRVNSRIEQMNIEFIYPAESGTFDFGIVSSSDVVIIPAFGVTHRDFEVLHEIGCIVVDTTCGSVLNVWKRIESYARDGFTAIVHGKTYHEETLATVSRAEKFEGGNYLVVLDMGEAAAVCAFIRGEMDSAAFMKKFAGACSPGFDPDRDLERIGVSNQTTMLASESLAIAARLGEAIADRWGAAELATRFRSFDTICSATQKRQDAVKEMMDAPPDLMIVVGGYGSSNTNNLAHLCARYTRTYHIEDAACIDDGTGRMSHKRIGGADILEEDGWLPPGEVEIGLTAGASTPSSTVGETIARILRLSGFDPATLLQH